MNWIAVALAAGVAGSAAAQHEHHHGGMASAAQPEKTERGQAMRQWTRFPLLTPGRPGEERAAVTLKPVGIETSEVQVFASDGPADKRRINVPVEEGGARIEPAAPKLGNYHWVVARSETEGEVRTASTAVYFSNPGAAPTAMLATPKHELEIVPQPLPREHGQYRESEKWNFLVRFNGAPLGNQPVTLETQFGTRSSFMSDEQGRVVVLFPRDFKPAQAGRDGGRDMGPRRAGFVLAAEHEADGKRYLTAFNYSYSPDADRDRSLAWGAAFGLLGMIAAAPLLRRRPTKETPNA
jgi:hypothetical protein